ncbi:MAG: glycosyltransferase [Solobacterium sp.]|nr:glycosyltransferase [Solobacterium sp.]
MNTKLLSAAVPCYNSQAYMEHCISTLLEGGGDDIQIIIVDDGSEKDNTAKIADAYMEKYPGIVRAVHQENGGHGEAVNTGLKNAEGLYFKVVDSDDWVGIEELRQVLDTLRELVRKNEESGDPLPDMCLVNYIYDKVGQTHKKVMDCRGYMPVNRVFTWKEAKPMPPWKYVMMHSVIYRTQMLRDSGLVLPKHTFYVDNIYVTYPFPFVKYLYYMDVDLYHYYIGRSDQSVNEEVMKSRIDQQLRVNKIMIDDMVRLDPQDRHARNYMFHYLQIITVISHLLCILINTEESKKLSDDLWEYTREKDEELYKQLHNGLMGTAIRVPNRKLVINIYHLLNKVYGFN